MILLPCKGKADAVAYSPHYLIEALEEVGGLHPRARLSGPRAPGCGLRHRRRRGLRRRRHRCRVHDPIVSKPFTCALALADRGFDAVLAKVGVEPSGEAFNEISLEGGSGRPLNPINAGAITTHSLAGPEELDSTERVERVAGGLSAFVGRRLEVDESEYLSEMEHAHRNSAIPSSSTR